MAYYKRHGSGPQQPSKQPYHEYEITWICDPLKICATYDIYDAIIFVEAVNIRNDEKFVNRYYDGTIESYVKKSKPSTYVDCYSARYKEAVEFPRKVHHFYMANIYAVARWKVKNPDKNKSVIDVTVKSFLGRYGSDSIPEYSREELIAIILNKNPQMVHSLYGDLSYESSEPFDLPAIIEKVRPTALIDRIAQHNAIIKSIRPPQISEGVKVRPFSLDLDTYQKLHTSSDIRCLYSAKPDGVYTLVLTMKNASKPHLITSGTQTIFLPATKGENVTLTPEDLVKDCTVYQGEYFDSDGLFVLFGVLSNRRINVTPCLTFSPDDLIHCKTGPIKTVVAKKFFARFVDIIEPDYKTDGYVLHTFKESDTMGRINMYKIKDPLIDTIDIAYQATGEGWARPLCMTPTGKMTPFIDPLATYNASLCINNFDLVGMPPIVEANFSAESNHVEVLNGRPDKSNPNKFIIWINKCCNNVLPVTEVIRKTESSASGAHSAKFLPRTQDLVHQNRIIRELIQQSIERIKNANKSSVSIFDWGAGKLGYFMMILECTHLISKYHAYDVSLQDLIVGVARLAKTAKTDNHASFLMDKYRIYTDVPEIKADMWLSVFAIHYLVADLHKECLKAQAALKLAKEAAGGLIITHNIEAIATKKLPLKIGTTTWQSIVPQKDGRYICTVKKDYAAGDELEVETHYGMTKYKEMFGGRSQIVSDDLSVLALIY